MKPYRILLTHALVLNYGMHEHMTMYRPHRATRKQLEAFHDPEFLDFIYTTAEQSEFQSTPPPPGTAHTSKSAFRKNGKFQFNSDCPAFPGMSKYIEMFCGASIEAGLFITCFAREF